MKDATKLSFIESKTSTRLTIKGFVSTSDDIFPFEKQLLADCAPVEVQFVLWDQVSQGSKHTEEWERLLLNDQDGKRPRETI